MAFGKAEKLTDEPPKTAEMSSFCANCFFLALYVAKVPRNAQEKNA